MNIANNKGVASAEAAQFYHSRAMLYVDRKKPNKALKDWNDAIALDPLGKTASAAYHSRASLLDDLGRREEAFAGYAHAMELDPDNAVALFNRALLHIKLKNWKEARNDR